MYAVIETGGKQYRVSPGDTIRVEKIEVEAGSDVEFSKVLMVTSDSNVSVGTPLLDGALVRGKVLEQGRAKKDNRLQVQEQKETVSQDAGP